MSPQFVDFNADGQVDIVAGTFDGSPHVAFGSDKGFKQPESILDRDGARIVLNAFWNFDTKKWDATTRCNPDEAHEEAHGTSAYAFDWEGDGDLDLLLGDHRKGYVFVRRNEGTAQKPAFATRNALVFAGDQPLRVPGTVTTLQMVDWDGDGRLDLLCGGMGDAYQMEEGGGVYVCLNAGTAQEPRFAPPQVLIPRSGKTGVDGPDRPDSGLYMHAVDADADGDLDLLVGGYSHWKPKPRSLSAAEQDRVSDLRAQQAERSTELAALNKLLQDATQGLDATAAARKRTELLAEQQAERTAWGQKYRAAQSELDTLAPGPQRVPYVWLYENAGSDGTRKGGAVPHDR